MGLDDLVKVLLKFVWPITRLRLLSLQLDGNTWRCLWVGGFVREVDVVLSKPGATLTPSAGQRDAYGIENSGLAGVVWTDEDGGFAKLDVEIFYRPEILNADPGYTHTRLPTISVLLALVPDEQRKDVAGRFPGRG